MIQDLIDHLSPIELADFRIWIDRHSYLLEISDKDLLLLVLFRLEAMRQSVEETRNNTKTHWS